VAIAVNEERLKIEPECHSLMSIETLSRKRTGREKLDEDRRQFTRNGTRNGFRGSV